MSAASAARPASYLGKDPAPIEHQRDVQVNTASSTVAVPPSLQHGLRIRVKAAGVAPLVTCRNRGKSRRRRGERDDAGLRPQPAFSSHQAVKAVTAGKLGRGLEMALAFARRRGSTNVALRCHHGRWFQRCMASPLTSSALICSCILLAHPEFGVAMGGVAWLVIEPSWRRRR
jgi:hypothetical protein